MSLLLKTLSFLAPSCPFFAINKKSSPASLPSLGRWMFLVGSWAFLTLVAATAATTSPNLLPNEDFQSATQDPNWPDGWPHDATQPVTWPAEAGAHFIRLVSQQPGQLVQFARTLPVPTGIKGLVLIVRFRVADFKFGGAAEKHPSYSKDIHFYWRFLDADGKSAGGGGMVFDSHAKDWTSQTRSFLIPEKASQLELRAAINRADSGTLDLARIDLAPMPDAEAQALLDAPALALKQQADDLATAQSMLTLPAKTPAIKVSGNRLVTAAGADVWLKGVNIPSLEWSAKGEHILPSVKIALVDWHANALRLPVYDGFWFGTGKPPGVTSNDADAYRKTVDDVIKMAAGQGAYVILDLHRFGIPEDRDVAFWKDAAARYKNNPAVLFDLFNEPGGIKWEIWRDGGDMQWKKKKGETVAPTVHSVGMQALINAVRSTGAKNIVIAGGVGSAYDLSGVLQGFALEDKAGDGIMYATHFYDWHGGWQKHFLDLASKYPLFVGEFGASAKKVSFVSAKSQEDPYTWMPDALGLLQKYHLNWTAFCMHPKAWPALIENWDYAPTPDFGAFVKDALAGKQFDLKKMR